jgi:hypothetical protein
MHLDDSNLKERFYIHLNKACYDIFWFIRLDIFGHSVAEFSFHILLKINNLSFLIFMSVIKCDEHEG